MSSDESITRLQNALATLAEMAVRSQEVDTQHEARINSLEESNRRIAQTNRDLAESNRLIVEMIRRHDERVDEFRAAREETEHKLAALVDAQIRGEESMEKLRAAQLRSDESVEKIRASQAEMAAAQAELAAAQVEFKASLDELRGSLARVVAVQEVTGQRIAELAAAQARTEAALERLSQTVETILRNGRGGQSLG